MEDRSTVTVDGVDYYIVPGTFVEGAVRRQAEFAYLGEDDLKSRPDTREFQHDNWIGGAQWEKPKYSSRNLDTYFESGDVSLTDRAGAVQQSAELQPLDGNLVPSSKFAAWSEDSVDGAISVHNTSATLWQWTGWDAGTDAFVDFASRTTSLASGAVCMAISAGSDERVYALFNTGDVLYYDPTANTNGTFDAALTVFQGTSMWVDRDTVWIYNGDKLFAYDINDTYAKTTKADDDWGIDALSRSATFTGKPIIPFWSCTRGITTSEGIFYVKNVFEGGLPVAKVYRVDKDASGSYILTPIGTLPKGQVAIEIAHHLGSILVSTVPNFKQAAKNTVDQKVTIYHVTGRTIGAVGSPLGGTNIDETPVWLLGAHNEMLMIGGRKRLWSYDGRVGAFHTVHVESATKYTDHGSGFTDMVTVDSTSGAGALFMHTSQDGLAAAPYLELLVENSLITTADDTAFVTSNWFDFDLPMEQKTVHEIYYDVEHVRTGSFITFQLSVDGGAFATVAQTAGGGANTARVALETPITGFKFQYKILFTTDTDTSSAEPGRVYSIGFAAYAGEMVDVMQFTIDGKESMNYENNVQVPEDVYDNMAALRANREEVVVVHSYRQFEAGTNVTNTYRVMNVTGRKDTPMDGMYEVQLVEVP